MFVNLLDRNTSGLNDALDSILNSVLGSSLNTVIDRVGAMSYSNPVTLDQDIINAFGLNNLLEGNNISVGKVEMEVLVGLLRILRGTLEWVASYDWNTDLSFLKIDWNTDGSDDLLMNKIKTMSTSGIPLRNNFLKARSNAATRLAASKADFVAALTAAANVWDHLGDSDLIPQGFKDELNSMTGIKTGIDNLKDAINNGTTFSPSTVEGLDEIVPAGLVIDMGKFFTPGQLAIDKLLELESGGKSPVFYGFIGDGDGVTLSSADSFSGYEAIGFKLLTAPAREVVNGLGDDMGEEIKLMLFPADIGQAIYELYHK
jgi:hypothetical protein